MISRSTFDGDRRVEAGDVERDDGPRRLSGEPFDETVADLAARAGDEHHGFAHARIILEHVDRSAWLVPPTAHASPASELAAHVTARVAASSGHTGSRAPSTSTRTMRVDYFHTGGPASGETLALDRVVNDGPWPGSRTQLIDATNLGKYFFEVRDTASGRVLYSRGFASIYGEWETTAEVKTGHRSFHESLRFPWPKQPVRVTLQKRQPDNRFATVWSTDVDPGSRFVNAAPLARARGDGLDRLRAWPGGREGRPAGDQRGLHASAAAEVPQGRRAPRRRPLRRGAVQEPQARLQRPGPRSAVGRERSEPAECRRLPAHAAVGRVQHLRLRALRADARQPCAARCRVGGALRVRRNPGQRAHLRRRRHLQRSRDRRRSTARLPSTCSSTSSGITSRRWPTSTTRPMSRTRPAPAGQEAGAVGAERHGARGPGDAEVARARRRPARRCPRRGRRRSSSATAAPSRSGGARSASATRPRKRWTRSFASSGRGKRSFSAG